MVRLTLIGSDFRQAPPSRLRELSARTEEIRAGLVDLRSEGAIRGGVLVSTCNRVEALLHLGDFDGETRVLVDRVFGCRDDFPVQSFDGPDTVAHLLELTAGLDSMVLGEEQILGQVGRSFQIAEDLGLMSRPLHMLRTRILATARDLRRRTGLARSARSVAAVAADEIAATCRTVCVVGAGETARLALDVLRRRNLEHVYVANRTLSRAEALAHHFGGEAISLGTFQRQRPQVDGVLFAVSSPNVLLEPRDADGLRKVVDISQPSVIDPALREIDGLEVVDLDDLAAIAARDAERTEAVAETARVQVRAQAERIWADVAERRDDFGKVVDLHVENALAELERALRGQLAHLADGDRDTLRKMVTRTAKRNAHFHLRDLRQLTVA